MSGVVVKSCESSWAAVIWSMGSLIISSPVQPNLTKFSHGRVMLTTHHNVHGGDSCSMPSVCKISKTLPACSLYNPRFQTSNGPALKQVTRLPPKEPAHCCLSRAQQHHINQHQQQQHHSHWLSKTLLSNAQLTPRAQQHSWPGGELKHLANNL
jgi:hypothetical protein